MKYHPIAQDLYHQMLLGKNQQGGIVFNFLNVSVTIHERSAIGHLFQE